MPAHTAATHVTAAAKAAITKMATAHSASAIHLSIASHSTAPISCGPWRLLIYIAIANSIAATASSIVRRIYRLVRFLNITRSYAVIIICAVCNRHVVNISATIITRVIITT